MKRRATVGTFVLIGAAVLLSAASPQVEKNPSDFLKGKVHYLDKDNLSLTLLSKGQGLSVSVP